MLLKSILSASAVVVLGSSAALANPDMFLSGAVGGLSLGYPDGENDTAFSAQAQASIAYHFTPVLGLQGDLLLNRDYLESDDSDVSFTTTSMDAALHAFFREQDRFLVGVIGQAGRTTFSFSEADFSNYLDRKYLGIEAQVFLDQLTIYGQLGVHQTLPVDFFDGMELGGFFATAEVRYFLNPDLKIELHAGLLTYDDPDVLFAEGSTLNIGASLEYKFTGLPVSAFAAYDYSSASLESFSGSQDDHRFLIGLKLNHGTDTLLDRDRAGASLKPVKPLPVAIRSAL